MKKNNFLILICLIIIIAIMSLVLIFMKTDEPKINYTEDEMTFKEEYEKLNGMELMEGYVLKTINIDSDNNIKYITDKDIIKKLTKGTNIIYFGWSDCNWCRSIVPTLVSTLKENEIDTLYYYDFKELRSSYEKGDAKKTKIYESILEIIGSDITSVFDEESKKSGEKKILAPTVVFIKDGEYVGLHVKSVESHLKSTDELTDEQILELKNIYTTLINKMNLNVCTSDEGC